MHIVMKAIFCLMTMFAVLVTSQSPYPSLCIEEARTVEIVEMTAANIQTKYTEYTAAVPCFRATVHRKLADNGACVIGSEIMGALIDCIRQTS